jgi:hypothetical protein
MESSMTTDLIARIRDAISTDRCDGSSSYAHGVNAAVARHTEMIDLICAEMGVAIPASEPRPAVPQGFALVPLRPNREMQRVMEDEGWQWEDLLGAAEAITDEQYAAITARQALTGLASIPDELKRIGELIRTQDSDYTANAVFLVEQERIVTGIDTDYDPEILWVIEDHMIFKGDDEFDALEAAYEADGTIPENYTRTGCTRQWDYLTQFFTRSAADAYTERHGHKFDGKLRVMIEGDHRNTEFNFVRDWLAGLPKEDTPAPTEQAVQPDGILTPIPLVEPVYIGKALLAHREAHVVLNSGVGPLAAVHLVNIGLTGWTHNAETATAYAEGYNTALKQYRGALAARQAPDSRNVWTDEQREQFRRDRKGGPRCDVCAVDLGGKHFPGCSKEGA